MQQRKQEAKQRFEQVELPKIRYIQKQLQNNDQLLSIQCDTETFNQSINNDFNKKINEELSTVKSSQIALRFRREHRGGTRNDTHLINLIKNTSKDNQLNLFNFSKRKLSNASYIKNSKYRRSLNKTQVSNEANTVNQD